MSRSLRLGILGIWVGLGLLESAKVWVSYRFSRGPTDWGTALIGNMPWWLLWAAFTPGVIALARRVRPEDGWVRFAAAHLSAATVLSLVHHVLAGTLYFYTYSRGLRAVYAGELVPMTLTLQFRLFFSAYFLLNVLTYFSVAAAWYGVEFYRRYRTGELRAARLESDMQRARLAALRMELNPHFLFNTLNAVSGLVRRGEREGAARMLARLSDLLRSTLEQADDPEVPLERELELLGSFLEIEQIRMGGRLTVEVTADATATTGMVPPLILQPLVENAVRHGVARDPAPGRIEVRAEVQGDELALTVGNTRARDAPPPDVESGARAGADPGGETGIGLANVRRRLHELYGTRAAVTLELNPTGARALVRIPYRRGPDDHPSSPRVLVPESREVPTPRADSTTSPSR